MRKLSYLLLASTLLASACTAASAVRESKPDNRASQVHFEQRDPVPPHLRARLHLVRQKLQQQQPLTPQDSLFGRVYLPEYFLPTH